jgi:hypothetical protein
VKVDEIDIKQLSVYLFCNRRPLNHPGSPFEKPDQNGKIAKSILSIYKNSKLIYFRATPKNSAWLMISTPAA